MNAVDVRDLARKFGQLQAVKGVTFEVREGELFGFLGPNGAGKTTTINMLCTLLHPSGGSAVVNGFDVIRQGSSSWPASSSPSTTCQPGSRSSRSSTP